MRRCVRLKGRGLTGLLDLYWHQRGWDGPRPLICLPPDLNIAGICQFFGTTALFRHVKRAPKKCVNLLQNSQKKGQHFAFSVQKRAPAYEKYTTAGGGGGD